MSALNIERTLMPNTYVKLLAREFEDLRQITRGTGISPEELADYAYPITVRQQLQFFTNAASLIDSPDWHLQWGKQMSENFHGAVTLAWLTAPTLGDGLDVFLKYIPSRVPYLHWQGSADGGAFRCEINELVDLGPIRNMLIEIPLIVMHEYVRDMRRGPINEARIELRYAAPQFRHLYADWFECPIEFESPRNALVIPVDWRRVANLGFDEGSWKTALVRCEAICSSSAERDALTHVQQVLFEFLDQSPCGPLPTLDVVADRLHVSPRTLIRRLRAIDTTFQKVSDEILKHRAHELLANRANSLHEVAVRLGYRDPAGFRRAFKRWYGMSPGDYRKQFSSVPP